LPHINDDISRALANLEATQDSIAVLDAQLMTAQIAHDVAVLRLTGVDDAVILALIVDDLQPGGRLYIQANNLARSGVFKSFQDASHVGEHAVFREAGFGGEELKWVNVNGGNVCPDCESRQGQTAPVEEWQAVGMPGSGWSVCRHNCQCRLEPVSLDVPDRVVVET